MTTITLLCSLGLSTSILIDKMIQDGKEIGLELDVDALPYDRLSDRINTTDILLLGPQVRYLLKKFEGEYGNKIPVIAVMNMSDYGLQNTKKILNDAMALYNAKKSS
jgi:PTS system cellobiose-specific IIB component